MTEEELHSLFEKHENEFLKFELVEEKQSRRADIHAFLLLDKLIAGHTDMVSAAEHDKIWLGVDVEVLAKVATENDVIELLRCGICLDRDGLYSFV